MNKKLIGLFAALIIITGIAAPAHAAGLTSSQVSAIIGLLRSFGADSSVISNVQVALGGTPTAGTNSCHTFATNLRVGASGSEVTALQTALKNDGESVSTTNTFDDQTASAVTGFQQKYASTILTPNGLQYGTGYVGAATRTKLNNLCAVGQQTISPPVNTVLAPTVSFTASPSTITTGQIAILTLSSSGADKCIVSNPSIGSSISWLPNDHANVSPTQTTTWTATCTGSGGSTSQSVTITVPTSNVSGLTSSQIQSLTSLLFSFGASNAAIQNATAVLGGGAAIAVPSSGLTSAQIQQILSLLSSWGATITTIANVSTVLGSGTTAPTAPITTVPQTATFTTNGNTVASGNTLTFSWSGVGNSGSLIVDCPYQVTFFDVTNNKNFQCGDITRPVTASGSDTIRFTNAYTLPMEATFQLDYGGALPLTQLVTVLPAVAATATITSSLTLAANTKFTISGTATMPETAMTIAISGVPNAVGDTVGPAIVQADGTWSLFFNFALPAGSYPVRISSGTTGTGTILASGTLIFK